MANMNGSIHNPYHSKESSLFPWMAKRVNVPGDPWSGFVPKGSLNKPQTKGHLVNNGSVVRGSFIIHAPASINKLQLAIPDKFFDLFG